MSLSLGILFGLIAMLGFGASNFFIKILTKRFDNISIAIFRGLFASLFLFLLTLSKVKISIPSYNTLLLLIIVGFIGALAYYSFLKAISIGKVSIVQPVANSFPIFVLFLSYFFLGEVLSKKQLTGITLVIIGIIVISFKYSELKRLKINNIKKGIPYAIITSVGWGIIFFLFKFVVNDIGPLLASFYIELVVFVFLLLLLFKQKLNKPDKKSLIYLLITSLCVAIASLSYNYGISLELLSLVAPVAAANPLVLLILARILLKEKLVLNQKIAVFMIIIGLVLAAL